MKSLHKQTLGAARRILLSSKRKKPVSREIADCAAPSIASQWEQRGEVLRNKSRISITTHGRNEATSCARFLAWMEDPAFHHGQQASEAASKSLRGIKNGSISGKQLFDHVENFRHFRQLHIDRNSAKRPFTRSWKFDVPDEGVVAERLTSLTKIKEVGAKMRNCLANDHWLKQYHRRVRDGNLELIVLYEGSSPVVLMSVDPVDQLVEEIKGPGNECPLEYRNAIVATLAARGRVPGRGVGAVGKSPAGATATSLA